MRGKIYEKLLKHNFYQPLLVSLAAPHLRTDVGLILVRSPDVCPKILFCGKISAAFLASELFLWLILFFYNFIFLHDHFILHLGLSLD